MDLQNYPEQDHAYLLAHDMATQMLRRGEIKAFSASYSHDKGRMIHVESDQGWDPNPMFQEHEEIGHVQAYH